MKRGSAKHVPPVARAATSAVPDYLRAPFVLEPLTALLLLESIFVFAAQAFWSRLFLLLGSLGVLSFFRAPRWLCHLLAAGALVFFLGESVFVVANQGQDSQSVRDDAVEVAAQRFAAGINPWTERGPLMTPITSGPASVLLAVPAVITLGRVDELTFAFYLAFVVFLLVADARRRNATFVPLSLFVVAGLAGFQHTLYWSLEELYWGYAALAFVPWLVKKDRFAAAGVCLAFAFFSRSSYAFPIFAALCWWWNASHPGGRDLARLAAGAIGASVALLAPFAIVVGTAFLVHNPFTAAGDLFSQPAAATNQLFVFLNAIPATLGPRAGGVVKIVGALALIAVASRRLASGAADSFFWHLCFGAFVANFLVYRSQISQDYALFFAVPAFLAVAVSPGFGLVGRRLAAGASNAQTLQARP